MTVPFLAATVISLGAVGALYYKVSRRTYNELEEMYGESVDGMPEAERRTFLVQKIRKANEDENLNPTFTDFRFSGYKLFAKRHGINLGKLF